MARDHFCSGITFGILVSLQILKIQASLQMSMCYSEVIKEMLQKGEKKAISEWTKWKSKKMDKFLEMWNCIGDFEELQCG